MDGGLDLSVKELVRVVGRCFYSDEHVVVLDRLVAGDAAILRESELQETFNGLSRPQVVTILTQLQADGIVDSEEVTEAARNKQQREYEQAQGKGMVGATVVVDKGERKGEEEDAGAAQAGQAHGMARRRRRRLREAHTSATGREQKITARLFFINPRRFVDTVQLRVHLLTKYFDAQRSRVEDQSDVVCGSCRVRLSMQHALALERSNPGDEAAIRHWRCPHCDQTALKRQPLDRSHGADEEVPKLWRQQLHDSGLEQLLKKVSKQTLGSNRPSLLMRDGKITLRHSRALDQTGGHLGRGGAGGVFNIAAAKREVEVRLEGAGDALPRAALGGQRDLEAEDRQREAAAAMPSHLAHSSFTGRKKAELGFVSIGAGAGAGGAAEGGDDDAAAVTSMLDAFLQEAGGDGNDSDSSSSDEGGGGAGDGAPASAAAGGGDDGDDDEGWDDL